MGVRQRAAVVVCLVAGALVAAVALGLAPGPAGAQIVTLPVEPTTTTNAVETTTTTEAGSTTTEAGSTTPTVATTPATGVPSPSTTRPSPATGSSPTSTTTAGSNRGEQSPTTTTGDAPGASPTSSSLRPTTTEVGGVFGTTTSAVPSPTMETAATASGGMTIGNQVALIIAGLLGVALVLSVVTVRYVRTTRPGGHSVA